MKNKFETILFEKIDNVVIITINREKHLNAINSKVLNELKQLFCGFDRQDLPSGMIITGSGEKAFIAGADVKEMSDMHKDKAEEFAKLGQEVTLLIEKLPFVVIACVNGFALGGGCELAMACDFIFSTKSAIFGQPEVKLGLIPGFGGTQRLSRIVGINRAREIIYTGRNISSDEAIAYGLVLKSFDTKDELIKNAMLTIKEIGKNSPKAISISKNSILEGDGHTLQERLDIERKHFAMTFLSEDMKEGTKAFIEKRRANFTGK